MKLIKTYFNLYNKKLENKIRKFKIRVRIRKISLNNIFVSKSIFKHTNNEVKIMFFIYNRQKFSYTYFLKKNLKKFILKKFYKNLIFIKLIVNKYIRENIFNYYLININMDNKIYKKIIYKYYKQFLKNIYRYLAGKLFIRYKKYIIYKQLLYINKSKFNYNYLFYLQNILKQVLKKNVTFDIVNLKYFYLNSDIFTELFLSKIRKNRKNLIKKMNKVINKSNVTILDKFAIYRLPTRKYLNLNTNKNLNFLNFLVLNNTLSIKKTLKETVLTLIKYKKVTGVRLITKGRLSKRYTASKSFSKLRYKGNIRNLYLSSTSKCSSVLLRGNLRSNLQFTKLNSKTRIGSFGVRG